MSIRSQVVCAASALMVVAAFAVGTVSAQGQRGGFRGTGPGGGPGPLPMLQRLGLTDAQKEQVKGILSERSGESAGQTLAKLRIAQILTPEQRQKAREAPAGPRGRAAF